ncbi:MAG: hypothetical protein Q8M74_00185 [Chloroflexota bacterium]|nr:hypothetical protein [Chloroflexota bacterium]
MDRQLVDVLAVERRDEAASKAGRDLVVDLVAALLQRLDLGDALVQPVVAADHLLELAGCLENGLAVIDEQLEELLVAGDQADHRGPPVAGRRVVMVVVGNGTLIEARSHRAGTR